MSTIEDVKRRLSERESNGLSDNRFSIEYLNRSRCYLSVLKHYEKEASDTVLLTLYGNLKSIGNAWKEIAESSERTIRSRSMQNYEFFTELANTVWLELEGRAIR